MMQSQHYPFTLPPLPYAYSALAPCIDAETLRYHHDGHFKSYVDNLNKALAPFPQYHSWPLPRLLAGLDTLPAGLQLAVRRNGGGAYNHDLYFDSLAPQSGTLPAALHATLEKAFGTLPDFADRLKQAAMDVFGSGWGWLVEDHGALRITSTPNQDCPLTAGQVPLLPLDVWEHAYYLQYKNLRADYIDCWFQIVSWPAVAARMAPP